MMKSPCLPMGIAVCLGLGLAACGEESKSEIAELATCEKAARLAANEPAEFTVVGHTVEETSEGHEIVLEIDYTDATGAHHVWDRCWFAGYSDKKKFQQFSVRDSESAPYADLPDDRFAEILKQISG